MRTVFVFLLFISFHGISQNLFTVSLNKYTINAPGLKISEIIDARNDQRVLGIIQRGIADRKDLAVFDQSGMKDVEGMLRRSGLLSSHDGVVIRISKLAIFEITSIWRETAKAELSLDFFIKEGAGYYYVTSVYTSVEPKAMDVTHLHPRNIATVFEKLLRDYAATNKMHSGRAFTREQLGNTEITFRSITNMPIVKAAEYKDGYYATYEEFLNNEPSISIDCQVKPGNTTVVKCGNEERKVNIYGYAKGNKLYIFFHHDFYHLKRDQGGFAFRGPKEISNKDINNYYKSMLAVRQVGEKRGHYSTYRIDLNTGGITNTAGL